MPSLTALEPRFDAISKRRLLLLLGLLAVSFALVMHSVWQFGEKESLIGPDCIIALDASHESAAKPKTLRPLVERIAGMQRRYPLLFVVISSNRGRETPASLDFLRNELIARGVSEHRLLFQSEYGALDDQVRAAARLIAAEGYSRPLVIAESVRMRRIVSALDDLGLAVSRAPVVDSQAQERSRLAWGAQIAEESLALTRLWFERGGWRWVVALIGVLGLSWALPTPSAAAGSVRARIVRIGAGTHPTGSLAINSARLRPAP